MPQPKRSIIIPTYKEEKNIKALIEKIFQFCEDSVEVLVVDKDSPDGTKERVGEASKSYPVQLIIERGTLSEAVLKGIEASSGEQLLVMDADFSHPPKIIPAFFEKLERSDLVVGTRRRVEDWPLIRKIISKGASFLTFPLTDLEDPMSGFFAFKKRLLQDVEPNPIGYKILLEIVVKAEPKNKSEIQYVFKNRERGESKLGLGEYLNFLRHLGRLYRYKIFKLYERFF